MNVIGSRPDGWWRDREAAMRMLLAALAELARSSGDDVTVVFDGRERDLGAAGPVEVRFAPVADDEIAALVERDADPASLTVVTSDRDLSARVRGAGAATRSAAAFRRRLDEGSGLSLPHRMWQGKT